MAFFIERAVSPKRNQSLSPQTSPKTSSAWGFTHNHWPKRELSPNPDVLTYSSLQKPSQPLSVVRALGKCHLANENWWSKGSASTFLMVGKVVWGFFFHFICCPAALWILFGDILRVCGSEAKYSCFRLPVQGPFTLLTWFIGQWKHKVLIKVIYTKFTWWEENPALTACCSATRSPAMWGMTRVD